MAKQKDVPEKMRKDPTLYDYSLEDISGEGYAETLEQVFHHPEWSARMAKRSQLYKSTERMNQSQVNATIIALRKMDQLLAEQLYQALVMKSLSVNHLEKMSFNDCLAKLDMSKPDIVERKDRLATDLDGLTFLADVLESKLVSIKSHLDYLYKGEIEFKQFDGVAASLKQLSAYFSQTRSAGSEEEQLLFCDYAESIENFIEKRMKTYIRKYREMREKNKPKEKKK